MGKTEADLIAGCQNGRPEDFGRLYDLYAKPIYDFVYYRTHHKETAEDLTSQTFMKALNAIGNFDPSQGLFRAWLYRIARNAIIDHYRTRKNDSDIADAWDIKSNDDVERDADTRMKLEQVSQYLQKLTAEQRDLVLMRVWSGLSYREIAEITGKTEASCKMMFSRLITRLRDELPAAVIILILFAVYH